MVKRIVFTGGGTAGHVTPNLALIGHLLREGWQVNYLGSSDGVESAIIKPLNIPFHAIHSGKLRRYFSFKNFIDPFKIFLGIIESFWLMWRLKPDVVFSKGGFVAFPVVVGAWLNGIPVLAHESDMTPGLANRLSYPFARCICLTFQQTQRHFKSLQKVKVTGTPIREQLFKGNRANGLMFAGFNDSKPCLLVIGGSLGAARINEVIRESLSKLLLHFQVIHLCGKGKLDNRLIGIEGYHQIEYANEALADLLAASDLVISRAGANSLCELLALKKAHILIPLPALVSRGDQIQNAKYFEAQGISVVINEITLTSESLLKAVDELWKNKTHYIEKMKTLNLGLGTDTLIQLIKEYAHA